MAVGDALVCPGFPTPVTQLLFQSHRLLFSLTSEVRGEHTLEKKFDLTGYRTHNYQVRRQTFSSLSLDSIEEESKLDHKLSDERRKE